MKKSYRLEQLDCAHCASKLETAINKLPTVTKATVNFLTLKLTVEADDVNFSEALDDVVKTMQKIEPRCKIRR